MLQFSAADEHDFRVALSSGGRTRIDAALMNIDAEQARASVTTDRDCILAVVEREMGLGQFNALIRDGIKHEYTKICRRASFK